MEARKITVVTSRSKSVIMSEATTLGQLKEDLCRNGIDYTDMEFYEGLSRTTLVDDASILPTNLSYKGATTNELIISLTTKQKKIKSGAMNRHEAYTKVKELGLGEAIKGRFGKNFTQVKTDDLVKFIESIDKKAIKSTDSAASPATPAKMPTIKKEEVKKSEASKLEESKNEPEKSNKEVIKEKLSGLEAIKAEVESYAKATLLQINNIKKAISRLTSELLDCDCIEEEVSDEISEILEGEVEIISSSSVVKEEKSSKKLESSYDDDEISKILGSRR